MEYLKTLKKEALELQNRKVLTEEGTVGWNSPSNIAIVKYWGKYPNQIPANASLSITLKESLSRTYIRYRFSKKTDGPMVKFTFEKKENESFGKRISVYLNQLTAFLPWLKNTELHIASENTFPHSSGTAPSASAMSSLALGLCSIEAKLFGKEEQEDIKKKASFLARLGSGSAARSVYGNMAVWGATAAWKGSSDEYAIPIPDLHKDFYGMKDRILLIESGTKEVSSSLGHDLMKTNPYSEIRFRSAEKNMQLLAEVMKTGDFRQFIDIMENEALTLHAMMMTSNPGYILMKPNTLSAIQKIREYRKSSGKMVGFTLDAGANLHVIYPRNESEIIDEFIGAELAGLCENKKVIYDEMGEGPREIPVN